jgi:hypothetical protein
MNTSLLIQMDTSHTDTNITYVKLCFKKNKATYSEWTSSRIYVQHKESRILILCFLELMTARYQY